MLAIDGVICTETTGEESTRIAESAVSEPSCAVMVAVPADHAVTVPPLLTPATLVADEIQVTRPVIT